MDVALMDEQRCWRLCTSHPASSAKLFCECYGGQAEEQFNHCDHSRVTSLTSCPIKTPETAERQSIRQRCMHRLGNQTPTVIINFFSGTWWILTIRLETFWFDHLLRPTQFCSSWSKTNVVVEQPSWRKKRAVKLPDRTLRLIYWSVYVEAVLPVEMMSFDIWPRKKTTKIKKCEYKIRKQIIDIRMKKKPPSWSDTQSNL